MPTGVLAVFIDDGSDFQDIAPHSFSKTLKASIEQKSKLFFFRTAMSTQERVEKKGTIEPTNSNPQLMSQDRNSTTDAQRTAPVEKSPQGAKNDSDEYWDCYPGVLRGVENHGSPEMVKKLHEMEAKQYK